jgi:adenylate cyclase
LQETFGRHVGREAARQIFRRDPGLGGIEQEVTVLFADLRDFTARCADCTPQQTVSLLNRLLSGMVEVIEEQHGGMVNKFLGDGLMALFGAGDARHDHAAKAFEAGRHVLRLLKQINVELADCGKAPLGMGVGIHSGRAVVGSIGSPRRLEYTAIGDTVNVASRIEGLTKRLGRPLLLTADTRRRLPEPAPVEELPQQQIRGRRDPIVVYALAEPQAGGAGASDEPSAGMTAVNPARAAVDFD